MKRIAAGLVATGALLFAANASAFSITFPGSGVQGSGTFGSPANSFTLSVSPMEGKEATGSISFSGTDSNGTHSFSGEVTCTDYASDDADAGLLAVVDSKVGQSPVLYGVLIHVTPGGPGTGALDVTRLNHNQYRQYALGCPAAPGKTAIATGSITEQQYITETVNY